MDCIELIREARTAGLEIRVVDDKLVIRGPKSQEPLAKKLIEHKSDVIAVITQQQADPAPTRPCFACGSIKFWRRPDGGWVCSTCHPAPQEGVHQIELRDIRQALVRAVFELGETAHWPRTEVNGRSIAGTRHSWTAFTRTADIRDLRLAVRLLREVIGE